MSTEVREAGPDDESALRDLAAACPMIGPLSYCLEREPDFFALTRMQGERAQVGVIDGEEPGTIDAMATCVRVVRRVGGQGRRLCYLADLKVRPRARGRGLAGRLMERAAREMKLEAAPAFGVVLGGNRAMAPVLGCADAALTFRPMARLRNHSVFIGRSRKAERSNGRNLVVRRARRTDADDLARLWNRVQAGRDLSPVWDGPSLVRHLDQTPGLSFERLWLAERGGQPVGFAGAWDASATKQLRLVSLSRGLAWLRPAYNSAARLVGRAAMPADGELVPFVYVTHFCAETASDLRALLQRIHDDFVGSPYLYIDLALDVRDPLVPALDGFWKTSLAFDLHWITPCGLDAPDAPAVAAYFDMALV